VLFTFAISSKIRGRHIATEEITDAINDLIFLKKLARNLSSPSKQDTLNPFHSIFGSAAVKASWRLNGPLEITNKYYCKTRLAASAISLFYGICQAKNEKY
jgi:hypothetical protein